LLTGWSGATIPCRGSEVGIADTGARTIRCEGCGSAIELAELAPRVTCDHCGRVQRVDQALLDELTDYRDGVRERLGEADLERRQAAAWERSTAAMTGKSRAFMYVVPILAAVVFPTAVALTWAILIQQGVIAKEKIFYLSYILPGCVALGLGGYYAWYFTRYRRRKRDRAEPVAAAVRCPDCGSTNEIVAGQVIETCGHCGAALVPGEAARERGVDAARAEHRRAQMEKYRAERQGYAALQRAGMGPIGVILFAGGSFLLMLGGGTVAFTVMMITGDEPYSPLIFPMWAVTIALVAGIVLAIRWINGRKRTLREGVATLVGTLGGRPLEGLPGAVRWLNAYWAGPIDPFEMMPGTYYGVGEAVVGGYRVLVDVNPKPASQQHRAWSRILLACTMGDESLPDERESFPTDEAQDLVRRMGVAGFDVQVTDAGLTARADDDTLRGLLRAKQIAALSEPIVDLVRLAAALKARPVDEIP
jgi:ribosomal protein L37AE/L43A